MVHFILMTLVIDIASDFILASLLIPIELDLKHCPIDS